MNSIFAESFDEFTLFPELPIELRLKIWRTTFLCSRIVEIEYDVVMQRCLTKTPPPVALHVNHESRKEALRSYKLAFGTKSIPPTTKICSPKIYFNFSTDILYLNYLHPMARESAAHMLSDRYELFWSPDWPFQVFSRFANFTEDIEKLQTIVIHSDMITSAASFNVRMGPSSASAHFLRLAEVPQKYIHHARTNKEIGSIEMDGAGPRLIKMILPKSATAGQIKQFATTIESMRKETGVVWTLGKIE